MRFNGRKLLEYVVSFSKIITIAWLAIWIETILFSQVATIFSLGDTAAIQYINDNVIRIGEIICAFYFSTKCLENLAQGIEERIWGEKETTETVSEVIEEEDEIIIEPEPTQNVEDEGWPL